MTLKKRRRIQVIVLAFVALGIATVLIGYALQDGINYFRSPTQVTEAPPPPTAFVLMLFFHTVYAALLLFAGGLKWGGAAVAAANSAGVMALYRHHRRPKPIIA